MSSHFRRWSVSSPKGPYRHVLYTNFLLYQEPNPGAQKEESDTKNIMIRAIKTVASGKKEGD